jgi:hypothetical protein
MGGSSSKPATVDPNKYMQQAAEQLRPLAKISESEAQALQAKALQAQAMAEQAASAATAQAGRAMSYLKYIGGFVLFAGVLVAVLYLVDYISIKSFNRSTIGLIRVVGTPDKPAMEATPIASKVSNLLSGSGESGDLLPSLTEATKQTLVSGKDLVLSSDKQGAYGMQWWMFIKDWNYGYGKEKSVLTRADPSNSNILNPKITLHPTDNTMKVSVSVFPEKEGGSSKTEPASTNGSSSATDDVFICEVPNLPLQTWFSVSVSIFSRNLDIYIDGKLVKSCLLSGVPKPALGDILLSPDGGFSGYLCNFNYYSRMLTPADASNYTSQGTACRDKVPNNGVGGGIAGTGYSLKIGTYDTSGNVIQEYKF